MWIRLLWLSVLIDSLGERHHRKLERRKKCQQAVSSLVTEPASLAGFCWWHFQTPISTAHLRRIGKPREELQSMLLAGKETNRCHCQSNKHDGFESCTCTIWKMGNTFIALRCAQFRRRHKEAINWCRGFMLECTFHASPCPMNVNPEKQCGVVSSTPPASNNHWKASREC